MVDHMPPSGCCGEKLFAVGQGARAMVDHVPPIEIPDPEWRNMFAVRGGGERAMV